MDKPTTPGGTGAGSFQWPEDSGSGGGVGATGAFGMVQMPEEPAPPPPKPASVPEMTPPLTTTGAQRALGAMALQEPVVHKVVFGGPDESSTQLLDRIRMASAERAVGADRQPAPAVGGQEGFTELLRSLGSEPGAPAPAVKPAPALDPRPGAPVSGFTSLLQSLNAPAPKSTAAEKAKASLQADLLAVLPDLKPAPAAPIPAPPVVKAAPLAPIPVPAPPKPAPPAPSSGGFTELLRMSGDEPRPEGAPPEFAAFAAATEAPPVDRKGGTFTQLFGTFAGEEASAPSPLPVATPPPAYPSSAASSFTQLWSMEQQSDPAPPPVRQEPPPMPMSVDYARTPAAPAPVEEIRDPFAQTMPEALPSVPSTPPASRVGLTDLIHMLDEAPALPPLAPVAPPASPAVEGGPGLWTREMAKIQMPSEPVAPPAPPSWAVQPLPASPVQAPIPQAGPSEVTRIFEASKLRELGIRDSGGGDSAASAPPVGRSAPPGTPMPAFSAPPPPAIPGGKGMPPPPPMPAYPASPAPPGGAMPPMPQAPAMAVPPAPAPAAPKLPAVNLPAAGASKLQQFVPLMLVMIIVLLVVILVTVFFMMKH